MTDDVDLIVRSLRTQKAESYLPKVYQNNRKPLKDFEKQRDIVANLLERKDAAVVEFPVPPDGTYGLVGVDKPLLRDTIHINPINLASPSIFLSMLS
jgi:hypothetical protein